MGRLIDADALKAGIQTDTQSNGGMADLLASLFVAVIDGEPTIDPIRHGQWMSSGGFSGDECSECTFSGEMDGGARYCPSCGAKMDKAVQNEAI